MSPDMITIHAEIFDLTLLFLFFWTSFKWSIILLWSRALGFRTRIWSRHTWHDWLCMRLNRYMCSGITHTYSMWHIYIYICICIYTHLSNSIHRVNLPLTVAMTIRHVRIRIRITLPKIPWLPLAGIELLSRQISHHDLIFCGIFINRLYTSIDHAIEMIPRLQGERNPEMLLLTFHGSNHHHFHKSAVPPETWIHIQACALPDQIGIYYTYAVLGLLSLVYVVFGNMQPFETKISMTWAGLTSSSCSRSLKILVIYGLFVLPILGWYSFLVMLSI